MDKNKYVEVTTLIGCWYVENDILSHEDYENILKQVGIGGEMDD